MIFSLKLPNMLQLSGGLFKGSSWGHAKWIHISHKNSHIRIEKTEINARQKTEKRTKNLWLSNVTGCHQLQSSLQCGFSSEMWKVPTHQQIQCIRTGMCTKHYCISSVKKVSVYNNTYLHIDHDSL